MSIIMFFVYRPSSPLPENALPNRLGIITLDANSAPSSPRSPCSASGSNSSYSCRKPLAVVVPLVLVYCPCNSPNAQSPPPVVLVIPIVLVALVILIVLLLALIVLVALMVRVPRSTRSPDIIA